MATEDLREAMTLGTITTLGALRSGDVGMFVLDEGESKPFVATAERDGGYVVIEYTNGGGVHSILSPVRYLGRGRIEPARIVMEGEGVVMDRKMECECAARSENECVCGCDWTPGPVYALRDRVAELEKQVRTLREACIRAYLTVSVYHEAVKILGEALAATAPKENP